MTEKHKMVLEETKPSGEENWYCPTCGRRMIITWNPWKRVVIEQGDFYAAHSGSKGGLKIGVQVSHGNQSIESSETETAAEDPYLAPWMQWLENVDLDDLRNGED
jgi:hypothetical protein